MESILNQDLPSDEDQWSIDETYKWTYNDQALEKEK